MKRFDLLPVLLAAALVSTPLAYAAQEPSAADLWNDTKLEMSYLLDLQLNPFDIVVEVNGGTAHLAGTLPNAEDKARAERLALQIDGIDKVRNDIVLDRNIPQNRVRYTDPDKALSDNNIAAMLRAQLSWHRVTTGEPISVSVADGTVTLAGTVSGEPVRREAVRVAENTRLVNRVVDKLVVGP